MLRVRYQGIVFAFGLCLCAGTAGAAPDAMETLRGQLYAGQLTEAAASMERRLAEEPQDDRARFALGAVQLIRAVERLDQALYGYGLRTSPESVSYLPFFRLPVPENPNPEHLTYAAARAILQQFVDDLARAEETLGGVHDPDATLPLNIGLIRLDMNGDGKIADDETLWRIYQRIAPLPRISEADAQAFVIDFDGSDVPWLRAYCHLLMGLGEFLLAYDWHEAFDHTFQTLFPKAGLPYAILNEENVPPAKDQTAALEQIEEAYRACLDAAGTDMSKQGRCVRGWDEARQQLREGGGRKAREQREFAEIADVVAFIHLNHWPVAEPDRMAKVLAHLESMVTLSRASWMLVLAETDDRNEWIPNPTQKGAIPGMTVTQARIDGWLSFLDEFEALLQGRKLLPHWRLARGINLRRVFLEPSTFDIVLWIQGSAAVPYLEDGDMTRRDTWRGIFRVFEGDFLGYAIWFN